MKTFLHAAVASFLFAGALAQAAQLTGTVTNKTTGKPAAGDAVVLVEPMTGMTEVAHTTVDGTGHYTLNRPSNAPALVKVTHQGAEFFADAPQSGAVPDIAVYDVAPKVEGVFVEADVLELEVANGQLHVIERYFVHNTSMPPRTQWSPKSFEIVLPEEAIVESAQGQRPSTGSLPTTLKLEPEWTEGPLRFQLPHPAGRRRQGYAVQYQLYDSLQRFLHVSSPGIAEHAKRWSTATEEHDVHSRALAPCSRRSTKTRTSRPLWQKMQRLANPCSSRFPAQDRCRAKIKAQRPPVALKLLLPAPDSPAAESASPSTRLIR